MIISLGVAQYRRVCMRVRGLSPTLRRLQLAWMIQPLVIFAASRGTVFLAGYLANIALPSPTGDGYWHAMASNVFLDVWARQDSAFYLGIATDGYERMASGPLSSLAFFPVSPLLTRLMGGVTGNAVLAGILVSHV